MRIELDQIIAAKGLTNSDVARELGVHVAQIGRWVRDGVPPKRMRPLSRLLDIPLDDLVP